MELITSADGNIILQYIVRAFHVLIWLAVVASQARIDHFNTLHPLFPCLLRDMLHATIMSKLVLKDENVRLELGKLRTVSNRVGITAISRLALNALSCST